jgi:hypothetical protein
MRFSYDEMALESRPTDLRIDLLRSSGRRRGGSETGLLAGPAPCTDSHPGRTYLVVG